MTEGRNAVTSNQYVANQIQIERKGNLKSHSGIPSFRLNWYTRLRVKTLLRPTIVPPHSREMAVPLRREPSLMRVKRVGKVYIPFSHDRHWKSRGKDSNDQERQILAKSHGAIELTYWRGEKVRAGRKILKRKEVPGRVLQGGQVTSR